MADLRKRLEYLETMAARGGSENERRVARKKADALRAKLPKEPPPPPRRPPRAAPRPATGRPAYAEAFKAYAQAHGGAPIFDVKTGEAAPGVKVHHHNGPGNWKIEIPWP
jgi:hypothetical protein